MVLLVRNRNGHSSDVIKQQFDSFFVLHLWIIKTFYTNSGQFTCNVFARNTLHTRACIGNTNSKCIAFLLAFPICSLYIFGVWFEFRKFAYDLFMKWMANVCCASILSPGKLKSTSKRQMSASMCQKRFYVIWKIMKTFLPFIQCMGCISSCTIDWISSLRQMNTLSVCTFFRFQCKNVCDKYTIVCIWLNSTNFLIEFIKNVVFFLLEFTHFCTMDVKMRSGLHRSLKCVKNGFCSKPLLWNLISNLIGMETWSILILLYKLNSSSIFFLFGR